MTKLSRRSFVVSGGAAALALPTAFTTPAAALADSSPVIPAAQEPNPYFFSLAHAEPSSIPGGIVRRCTKAIFPVLQGVAVFSLALDQGATRQPHMHTNAQELSYIASGSARAGIIGPKGERQVFTLEAGDLVFFPQGWMHWLENTAAGPMFALFMYSNEQPVTIDLSEINAGVPHPGY